MITVSSVVFFLSKDSTEDQDYPAGIDAAFSKISLNVKKNKLIDCQFNARKWLENTKSQQDDGERVSWNS